MPPDFNGLASTAASTESSMHPQTPQGDGRISRKLALLKKSGLFGRMDGVAFRRACSVDDLDEAYRLVHAVYSETGFIRQGRIKLRVRMFETTPKMATFVAKAGGRVVGVLSIADDSEDLGLPSDVAFKAEIDALRASGARLGEVTNQAVAREFRRTAVATELIRCAMAHGIQSGYDEGIVAVSPGHRDFYQMLGFREIGTKRSYSESVYDPVVAMSIAVKGHRAQPPESDDISEFIRSFMVEKNPFHRDVKRWAAEAERQFLAESLLRKVFVTETRFVDQCSRKELRLLRRFWGRKLFAAVTGRSRRAALREWITAMICRVDTIDRSASGFRVGKD